MKKVILTLSVILGVMLSFNSIGQVGTPVGVVKDGPVIKIDKDLHDYGTIEYEGNGVCVFKITNTGNAPLIISLCKGSCGCTIPSCPEQPIAPGATADITVKFDTKRTGSFHKSVTITSNAVNAPTKIVKIKGNVKAKPVTSTEVKTTPPTN